MAAALVHCRRRSNTIGLKTVGIGRTYAASNHCDNRLVNPIATIMGALLEVNARKEGVEDVWVQEQR